MPMTEPIPEYLGETKRRSRKVAALLTALCPGLGYMYIGQALKGVTINLLFLLMLETFVITFSILKYFPLLPFLVVSFAWITFTAFSIKSVLKQIEPSDYVLKGYNHWMTYSAMALGTLMLPVAATVLFISSFLIGATQIENGAMLPSMRGGDTLLFDRAAYRTQPPRQGDLVAVRVEGDVHILRVVAVEKDVVGIEGESVYVNGSLLERSIFEDGVIEKRGLLAMVETNRDKKYVITLAPKAHNGLVIEPTELDLSELFVMADNRSQIHAAQEASIRDSRNFGPISNDQVLGRPLFIGWSTNGDSTRWDRVGLRVQ